MTTKRGAGRWRIGGTTFFQHNSSIAGSGYDCQYCPVDGGGFRVYELPLALTNGGPVYSTYTVTQNILSYGVSNGEFGEGTALSVVFLILVVVVLLGSLAVLRHREGRLR